MDHWAPFEERCRDFVRSYSQSGFPVPIDGIMNEMLARWMQQPDLCGYFMLNDCSGHLASWIINYYGQPKLFIWQAEVDNRGPLEVLIDMLKEWINSINSQVPPALQVHQASWLTWHPEAVWRRYLRKLGIEPKQIHSEIEISI